DREGGSRALDAPPLLLSERGGCAPAGARGADRPHAAGAQPARAGATRASLPRMVPPQLAPRADLCGDPGGLSLVARHGGALVGASSQAAARRPPSAHGAARRPAQAPAALARSFAPVHRERV